MTGQNTHWQTMLNMSATIATFAVSIAIGMVLPPYVVAKVGVEAYGFTGLVNSLMDYASLLTIALNSVASRFITVAYHRGDAKQALRYYSSTIIANIAMSLVVIAVTIPPLTMLELFIRIPSALLGDVKALFACSLLVFVVSAVSSVYGVAMFIGNRLYITSLINLIGTLARLAMLLALFGLFPANIVYVGVAGCVMSLTVAVLSWYGKRRILPDLKFNIRFVSWKPLTEMIAAGIWNVVIKMQQIMSSGVRLLIANLITGPYLMGMLSVAQTIPSVLNGLIGRISYIFSAPQMQYYAQRRIDLLIRELVYCMHICGFFADLAFVTTVVMGWDFLRLWQPGQDDSLLYVLMVCSSAGFLTSGISMTLQNLPLMLNKLRTYSLVWLASGVLCLMSMCGFALLLPRWAIIAIAVMQPVFDIGTNVIFVAGYAARCLELQRGYFIPLYIRQFGATALALVVAALFRLIVGQWFSVRGWVTFAVMSMVCMALVAVADWLVLLRSDERRRVIAMLQQRLCMAKGRS
ncbi:hypothetical protein [Bifidobacterium felsineum]|uniref:Polysaccharide biosynthesis protein n=1 Tax=Bifidobacterium felsineum TaxID=2045440 RepID=A0A2M9HIP1_9BIFI|nr:hypothetical protein [Bifidobacterium felsineum]PJM76685.1 hypothetical protein CSQ86_08190 [Bifidobacterium felsineum]